MMTSYNNLYYILQDTIIKMKGGENDGKKKVF